MAEKQNSLHVILWFPWNKTYGVYWHFKPVWQHSALFYVHLDPARTFICMECGDIHFIEHNVCIAHIFGVAFKCYTILEKSVLDQIHSAAAFDCPESPAMAPLNPFVQYVPWPKRNSVAKWTWLRLNWLKVILCFYAIYTKTTTKQWWSSIDKGTI